MKYVACALLAAAMLAACTRGPQGSISGTLRIGIGISPTQLNPILQQNSNENFLDGIIFSELVTVDPSGKDVPDLAAAVPSLSNGGISRDGLTITYHLRRGVKWHDGAPFTSKDVAFTWRAIMNSANNVVSRRGYDQVASVGTPDDYTVVFHMKKLFAPAVDTIFSESDTPLRILPAHLLARYANLNAVAFNSAPIGTGPFTFVRWNRGDRIELEANPAYFLGRPKLQHITVRIIPDDNTTIAEIRSHAIDLAHEINGTSYNLLRNVGIPTLVAKAPAYTAILFNTARPPLNDVRVRRALVFGLDRQRITKDDTYGTGELAAADLSTYYWAYDAGAHPLPYDPAQAARLLDAAGWRLGANGMRFKNGQPLVLQLVYGQGSQIARTITTQAQAMLKPLGIEVQLKSYAYAQLYAAAQSGGILNGGKFDLTLYSWISGADPDDSSQWTCALVPPNGNNVAHYCSSAMEAAQRTALGSFDRAVRKRAYAKVQQLLIQDAPGAFFYYQGLRYAYAPALQGFRPNGISEGWNAYQWSI